MHFTSYKTTALLILLTLASGLVSAQQCTVRQRLEFRDLSPTAWQAFVSSVRAIQRSGQYDRLVRSHVDNQRTIHNGPNFLPWHRDYIRRFEQALQAVDKSVMLPYWNWAFDSQVPEESILFTDAYLGGNGRGSQRCVPNGQFKDWRPAHPSPHCMTRNWDGGDKISSLYGLEVINRLVVSSKTYQSFRTGLEGAPHAAVHNNIGADFSSMASPNDPLFYMHHAYVDKIWADWQRQNPSLANTYAGTNKDGSTAKLTDRLAGSSSTVSSVMSTRSLCYEYAELRTLSRGSNTRAAAASVPATPKAKSTTRQSRNPPRSTRQPARQPTRRSGGTVNRLLSRLFARSADGYYDEEYDAQVNSFDGGYSVVDQDDYYDVDAEAEEEANDDDCGCECECDEECEEAEYDQEPTVDIQSYTNSTADGRTVSAVNRDDLLGIRTPRRIPLEWIQMNGMDVTQFRQEESTLAKVCEQINGLPNYESPSALVNRPDFLQRLANKVKRFYAITKGMSMTLTGYHKAQDMISAVKENRLAKKVKNVFSGVERVIGKIALPGLASALSFGDDDEDED